MTDISIEVEHLHKRFGDVTAVEDVSMTVPRGSVVGLLGPNGAGKTTTIHCLTTLLAPDGGRATVAGHDVTSAPEAVRASIAVTGQFAAVDPLLSGRDNLVLFGRLLGLGRSDARTRADELLDRFDLREAAGKSVKDYSGGMRRRLDLAVSLVVERPVLILDEPTTGLDPRSRRAMWETISRQAEGGTTVLLATQNLEEADELADRVVVIDCGRVIREAAPSDLKAAIGGAICELEVDDPGARDRALAALRSVARDVSLRGDVIAVPADTPRSLSEIMLTLDGKDIVPDAVRLRQPSLEDVFFAITGQAPESEDTRAADDGDRDGSDVVVRDQEEAHA